MNKLYTYSACDSIRDNKQQRSKVKLLKYVHVYCITVNQLFSWQLYFRDDFILRITSEINLVAGTYFHD